MTTQAELAAALKAVDEKLTKIGNETKSLLKKIEDLTAALANSPISPEAQAELDKLTAQADVVDALVDDQPPAPPSP